MEHDRYGYCTCVAESVTAAGLSKRRTAVQDSCEREISETKKRQRTVVEVANDDGRSHIKLNRICQATVKFSRAKAHGHEQS